MIGGGFPCQDISLSGLQRGISGGERSGLFFEIIRLIDETPSIQYVFLENVSNITKCGMKEVVDELVFSRGWSIQWTMKSAAAAGAPHMRNRWFCLGVKPGAPTPQPIQFPDNKPNTWKKETEPPRVSFKPHVKIDETYDEAWIQRCQALGNSVVPCVVRDAFIELWRTCCNVKNIFECFETYSTDIENLDYPYPERGIILNKKFVGIPLQIAQVPRQVNISITGPDGSKIGAFPTPRRGITHASAVTDRSMHDLPTVLLNSHEAIDYMKNNLPQDVSLPDKLMSIVIPSVNYIEWMMGYSKDWTRIPQPLQQEKKQLNLKQSTNKSKRNGMHVFMHENPGKDVKTIASMWRTLDPSIKAKYTAKAKS
jgi:hypothetical protein